MKLLLIPALVLCFCKSFAQDSSSVEIIRKIDHLIQNYKFEEALVLMDQAQDSSDTGILHRKGFCYSKLGNYGEAIKVYETMRGFDSLNRESLYNLGQLYSHLDKYDLARACFQTLIELDSTNSFYYKQYAALSQKANAPLSAIGFYLQTVRLNPHDMEAYGQLATILLDAEQYHFVDSVLTGVLAGTENNHLRLLLARAKLGQDEFEAVIENIDQILLTGDTTATYARLMGISYFQLDRYKEVIPWMQFLVGKGAKADWIFYYLGVAYQQEDDPVNAIHYLNLAIEESISDNIGTYYTQLAAAYEEVKDFKNAIRNYKIAYETSKADILLYHLARNYDVYYKDKTQAQIYYKKYLDSDDTVKIAKKYSQYRLDMLTDSR